MKTSTSYDKHLKEELKDPKFKKGFEEEGNILRWEVPLVTWNNRYGLFDEEGFLKPSGRKFILSLVKKNLLS